MRLPGPLLAAACAAAAVSAPPSFGASAAIEKEVKAAVSEVEDKEAGGKDAALKVKEGRVYYEGRDVDAYLKELSARREQAEKRAAELVKTDPKAALKLEAELGSIDKTIDKYAALREKALAQDREKLPPGKDDPRKPPDRQTQPGAGAADAPRPAAPARPPPGAELPVMQRGRSEAVMGRVRGMAAGFADSARRDASRQSVPEGTPGAAERLAQEVAGGLRRPSLDPAAPEDEAGLALASVSGFKDAFARHGLRVERAPQGAGRVVRQDGSPAAPAQLAALRDEIRKEPRALTTRPDFFTVMPREDFQNLKGSYRQAPQAPAFRDMGLTPDDRDFAWSRSCSRVSGDCNAFVRSWRYDKGKLVPPEDLAAVSKAAQPEEPGEDEDWEWDVEDLEEAIRGYEHAESMLGRRIGAPRASLTEKILSAFGWSKEEAELPEAVSGEGQGSAPAARGGAPSGTRGAPGLRPPDAPDAAGLRVRGSRRPSRAWPWALAAAGAALILLVWRRARRSGPDDG
ncbi:MAG: hypothetical protein HY926_10195 [Elusimicrobia bacterium]|nr:hypothetical protein [Elusimicrobiota bacterium]